MTIDQEVLTKKIDDVLNSMAQHLAKSSIKEEDAEDGANGGYEAASSNINKAKEEDKKEDDEDEDEDDDDEDKDIAKSILLMSEGLSALSKAFMDKEGKKKKKKKDADEDVEEHKDVAIKHICDNKDKEPHKDLAIKHFKDMKKSFDDELILLKSEIQNLKNQPNPAKGIPAGVQALKKSEDEVPTLSKAEAINEVMQLKKANPSAVDTFDIMETELGNMSPADLVKKYKKGQ